MSPTDPKDIDPLADLDDDLGDDWESAFQSEDFMFSPDEEANDFFLFDENDSEEDVNELTSIMENAEKETLEEQQNATLKDTTSENSETDPKTPGQTRPAQIISTASGLLSSFKNRPLYQRIIITAAPCCILLLFLGTFFFKSTSEELAQTKQHDMVIADVNVGPDIKTAPTVQPPPKKKTLPPQPEKEQVQREKTIRKQWDFPTFTIVSTSPDNETLFVNINLSLIAVLPEGGALPEGKNTLAKDIIYQFYQNRSPRELQHFALARGEMIHKLHHWLQKEWPDSPVNTVIFSQYQVIRTPHTS